MMRFGMVMILVMTAALAINVVVARHLQQLTREREAQRVLPPLPVAGERYTGDFRDGRYEGRGRLVYDNGEKYYGEFRNGQRDGRGTYTWPDGRRYVGEFRNGMPDGQGRFTLPNGEEYIGTYRNNRREGQGVYTWPDRRRYEGEFYDNLPNGKGTLLANGQRYHGWFRNGEFAGEELSRPPLSLPQPSESAIALRREGVNFAAPVVLNDIVESQFLVDSGAADVMLPMNLFDKLVQARTIQQSDMSGFETYRMANGVSVRAVTFRLHSLRIGAVVLDNVRAAAVDGAAPPLLGMSVLGRMKAWSLDNERQMLTLTAYER